MGMDLCINLDSFLFYRKHTQLVSWNCKVFQGIILGKILLQALFSKVFCLPFQKQMSIFGCRYNPEICLNHKRIIHVQSVQRLKSKKIIKPNLKLYHGIKVIKTVWF